MRKKHKAKDQLVILVDENDNSLGVYAPRHKAHTGKGLRHRAFVCFVLDKDGRILLQKRKHWLWDGLWDLSAVSHPLFIDGQEESYQEGASRALKKEMGVGGVVLEKIGGFSYYAKHEKDSGCENEYCAILYGRYDGTVKGDKEDIYEYKWTPFEEFIKDTKDNPQFYTPWAVLTAKALRRSKISLTQ
ncbi:MAG: NUDIX domain-containing protein [Candidatus Blackburnbacteria bacterium]|nr:NUDIX domain-containing protein [Candidatus Blackburnbacteria bacterium]